MTTEQKDRVARILDKAAEASEDDYAEASEKALERDHRAVRARVNAAKALFLERKQSVDWELIERDWKDYFENEAPDNWRELFHPLIIGTARDVNDVWTTELGIQFNVQNWLENAALEFEAYEMTFSEPILDTTQSDLFALLHTARQEGWTIERLNNAIDRLWDVYLRDESLTDEERQWFVNRTPRYRVEMIARTETMHSANFASPQLFRAYGADRHEWVATNDARTRPTHAAADGQVVVIGQPFEVGASLMLHPLDGSLGASASEIVQCRCVTAPVIEEGTEKPVISESVQPELIEFENSSDATTWLKETPELNPVITPDQNQALGAYKGDQFLDVNDQLRMAGYSVEVTEGGIDIQESVDEVFNHAEPLKQEIRVYRGLSYEVFEDEDDLTGDEVQDDAYVSTSLVRSVAEDFSDGIVVELRIPAGAKALNMERWRISGGVNESEMLLPRESRFKVISDTGADDDDREMVWELIV